MYNNTDDSKANSHALLLWIDHILFESVKLSGLGHVYNPFSPFILKMDHSGSR